MQKHKVIPSGYVVLKRRRYLKEGEKFEDGNFVDEVLLLRRFATGYMDGMYGLPAGHGEAFESLIGCAIREAREEVGVNLWEENEISVEKYGVGTGLKLGHIMNRYSGKYSEDCRIDGFFVLENYDEKIHGEIKNMEVEKCDDLSWFPVSNLPNNIISYIKLALENMEKNILFSEV